MILRLRTKPSLDYFLLSFFLTRSTTVVLGDLRAQALVTNLPLIAERALVPNDLREPLPRAKFNTSPLPSPSRD